MDGGLFTNLFEIRLPESLAVYSKAWNGSSIRDISARMYPINVYGDNTSQKVFAHGDPEIDTEIYEREGFLPDTVDTQENPRYVGRFAADAIAHHLRTRGFVLAKRPYTTYKRELVHVAEPLQMFYGSLEVYPSYNVQVMYLNFDRTLKYLLVIAPRLRYEFVIPIERIVKKVDCTGRFVKLTCSAECNMYSCKLHKWRGRVMGRFGGFTNQGFYCEYLATQDGSQSHVTLSDARLDLDIPAQVCHLEASLSNIRFVFEGVFDKGKVNDLIGRIRVFEAFGIQLEVSSRPLRAVEGVPLPEQDYGIGIEEEDDGNFGDVPF